ncbi:MAG: T9SS type A sorting domain-containing protein [Bacteroidetes bacterium]|nr:T9SS type A sorting domain-containing protein [Bacteroidota bacterium]MBU1681092.1 T9SS type A sorting domain-containing protein [Bacteroidota bacterium]MBU2507675.1 T9SS type A sorting domain-containing protein [Bacteroidota bacterium]
MGKFIQYSVLITLLFSFSFLVGRSFRVNQLPNGNVKSCANCHVSASGGGARNTFGSGVEAGFLDISGNVKWGPQLAALDFDNDGFTNGEELQDPNGAWVQGQPAPGDPTKVTNPGNSSDFPPVSAIDDMNTLANAFELKNNYPNPFNPTTTIIFSIPMDSFVSLSVYNSLGEKVRDLVSSQYSSGSHKTVWNGRDNTGAHVNSGMYIYKIDAGEFSQAKRMLLVK